MLNYTHKNLNNTTIIKDNNNKNLGYLYIDRVLVLKKNFIRK